MRPANFGKSYPAEVLTPGEVHQLLAACPRRGPTGLRNRAIIVVLWCGGLRIAEALALELRDVDLDRGTITVRHGKGNKRRTVGIDPTAVAVIDQWIACRRGLGVNARAPLCEEGVPLPVIQAQLGHSSLSTTARYVSHFAPMEVIRTMQGRSRHWDGTPTPQPAATPGPPSVSRPPATERTAGEAPPPPPPPG